MSDWQKDMNILVTGGRGFIGKSISQCLQKEGYNVTCLDKKSPIGYQSVKEVVGDVLDRKLVTQLLENTNIVVHLSSIIGTEELFEKPTQTVKTNVNGFVQVCDMGLIHDVSKIIYVTKPLFSDNFYTASSLSIEAFAKAYNSTHPNYTTGVRLYNVFGQGQSILPVRKLAPIIIAQALLGETISIFGKGDTIIGLQFIEEVANYMAKSIKSKEEIVDTSQLCTFCTVREFVDAIIKLTSSRSDVQFYQYRRGERRAKVSDYNAKLDVQLKQQKITKKVMEQLEATVAHYRKYPAKDLINAVNHFRKIDTQRLLLSE